jgi:GH25 family lysozyme M1 (1,4-beta-N-acetylmuramidase)
MKMFGLKGLVLVLLVSLSLPVSATAVSPFVKPVPLLTANLESKEVPVGQEFKISGKVSPARKGVKVARQRLVNGTWVTIPRGVAITRKTGRWEMQITAPAEPTVLKYRFVTIGLKKKSTIRKSVRVFQPTPPVVTVEGIVEPTPALTTVTLSGTYQSFGKDVILGLQLLRDPIWADVDAEITYGVDAWVAQFQLPDAAGDYSYRIVATNSDGFDRARTVIQVTALTPNEIDRFGPGLTPRILGMDVARYQRLNSQGVDFPINYGKAFENGMRFVIAKASDDLGYADDVAAALAPIDRTDAQAAGLYTGLYHFMGMTTKLTERAIILDARDEAIHATMRLVQLGGYNALDLPYTLDVEYSKATNSGIADRANGAQIRLWVRTFLQEMYDRTGRWPMVYGSPSAMKKMGGTDSFWEQIPFWVARYVDNSNYKRSVALINAGRTVDQPTLITNPWFSAGATQWKIWQYSSSGPAQTYGVRNGMTRLDMNVFNGSTQDFLSLVKGAWNAVPGDYVANQSAVNLMVSDVVAPPNAAATFVVKANRVSNGTKAVSGEVTVRLNGKNISGSKVMPNGVGEWLVTLPRQFQGFQWQDLSINFSDTYNFYAPATVSTTITVV